MIGTTWVCEFTFIIYLFHHHLSPLWFLNYAFYEINCFRWDLVFKLRSAASVKYTPDLNTWYPQNIKYVVYNVFYGWRVEILFCTHWVKWNVSLKLIFPLCAFPKVTTRKFKITVWLASYFSPAAPLQKGAWGGGPPLLTGTRGRGHCRNRVLRPPRSQANYWHHFPGFRESETETQNSTARGGVDSLPDSFPCSGTKHTLLVRLSLTVALVEWDHNCYLGFNLGTTAFLYYFY